MPLVERALSRQCTGPVKPAISYVVGGLPHQGALVAMDAVAVTSTETGSREIKRISAPGLYEQKGIEHAAVLPSGPKIYVSGMADTNSLPEATRKTLEKLAAATGRLDVKKE